MLKASSGLAALWLASVAGVALAQAPTLKTINIDGNLSDWDEVLLNPVQVTLDGDGSSVPCAFSTDLDCDVQSTGRDLRRFAWTYDATDVFFFVERQGNVSNTQVFWFYMDLDLDGLMGGQDKVLRVRHSGSTGVTQNDLYRYLPADPAGDPMVDAGGNADGYTLPGNLVSTATWTEGVPNGGSASGLAFEERVPWSQLGVAPGTGLNFHVASSNSANPGIVASQADDNLGGPGGSLGTFAFDLVSLTPDNRSTLLAGGTANYAHVVDNTGTRAGTYALKVSSTVGLAVSLYEDVDGDGTGDVLMATDANGDGDFADVGDFLDPAYDSDADGFPDTGVLAPGETFEFVVSVVTTPAADGLSDVTTVTTWNAARPVTTASAVDISDVGAIVVTSPDPARNSVEGQNALYSVKVCNNGAPDTIDLTAISSESWQVSLYTDPECDGIRNEFIAQDRQGDGTWGTVLSPDLDGDTAPDAGDTDGDGNPDTGLLATGECECFVVEIRVANRPPIGTVDVTTINALGGTPGISGSLDLTTTVTARLELFPDYTFALQTEKVSGANRSVYFAHVARNNWLVADSVDFTTVAPTNTAGWTVRVWSDPNGDGNIFDGQVITRTSLIPPGGGEVGFIVEVRIPAGVASGTTNTTVVTGAAVLDTSVRDTVTDQLEVSSIASYSDPLFQIATTIFAPCTTIFVEGSGLERDRGGQFEDIYDLLYFDAAGRNVRFHDPFVPDLNGVAHDQYGMQAPDVPGPWRIELRQDSLTIATLNITVEANGVIDPLTSTTPLYPLVGAPLSINSRLTNQNTSAPLQATRVEYVILDPTRTQYLVSGAASTFQPWDGTQITRTQGVPNLNITRFFDDPFTIPNVTYPVQGVYTILATWRASCGIVIAQRESTFIVGAGELDCDNNVDDDGDILIDCADPECARDPACFELDCDDGADGDGDTLVDCNDPDCDTDPACQPESLCANGFDDDGDTLVDCDDPDCATLCPEDLCNDNLDNDGDTVADCLDPDCRLDPACFEGECSDTVDNDGDTDVDCDDADCVNDPACQPEIDCSNGGDDDGDTLVDCDDPDCVTSPDCVEDCADGDDNDGDTLVDCEDPDCVTSPDCVEDCGDGVDNDGDTLADCLDPDCATAPECVEDCDDGVDNNGDTLVDCLDADCLGVPECVEDCDDGVDNDGDGDVDCLDANCLGAPECDCVPPDVDSDGDQVCDSLDCAPLDPTSWQLPGPVADTVRVSQPFGTNDAVITWAAPAGNFGTALVYDVATGLLSELRADRDYARAGCLAGDLSVLTATDTSLTGTPSDGHWYLVRAQNGCGGGPWGDDSLGNPRVLSPPAPCD